VEAVVRAPYPDGGRSSPRSMGEEGVGVFGARVVKISSGKTR
jgi:hypothetical protein